MDKKEFSSHPIIIPVILLLLLVACTQNIFSPTPTCSGGWGPYIGKDDPKLSNLWIAAFSETGLEGRDIKVQGVGETWTWFCNGKTTETWGAAYTEIQATIIIDDISDIESIGKTIAEVYKAVKSLIITEKELSESSLSVKLISREDNTNVIHRFCNINQGILMMEQGNTGIEIYDAACHE